jgi:GTPase SAR1 family protein
MRHGEGFILCYSIADRRSFDVVMENKTLIDRVRNRDDMPLVLVATKCDLKEKRVVSVQIVCSVLNIVSPPNLSMIK